MAKPITEIESADLGNTVSGIQQNEFKEALKGKDYLYAEVKEDRIYARIKRPGDTGDKRKPEPCRVGDIVRIEMRQKCTKNSTHEYMAWLLASGRLRAITESDFNNARNYTEVAAEREAREARETQAQQIQVNEIDSVKARLAVLEAAAAPAA